MSVRADVEQFIRQEILLGQDWAIGPDTSFLEEGILDSTSVLQLVAYLEDTYAIRVETDEIQLENLDTLARVEAYVARKQATIKA